MSSLNAIVRAGQVANAAERAFARQCDQQGKTWFYQPKVFRLPIRRSYRPDFYVMEDGCFYEIAGSRQAYSQRREQIEEFRAAYPQHRLVIVNGGAWKNGPGGPRSLHVRQSYKPGKHSITARLARAVPGTPASAIAALMRQYGIDSLADLSRRSGLSYHRLLIPNTRNGDRLVTDLKARLSATPPIAGAAQ